MSSAQTSNAESLGTLGTWEHLSKIVVDPILSRQYCLASSGVIAVFGPWKDYIKDFK